MRITIASVLVDDQEKALQFYTNKLGFQKKTDVPTGDYRWLTVVSPNSQTAWSCSWSRTPIPRHGRSRTRSSPTAFRGPRSASPMPARSTKRLKSAGVRFVQEPAEMVPVVTAVFDDTCGNLIQIAQQARLTGGTRPAPGSGVGLRDAVCSGPWPTR